MRPQSIPPYAAILAGSLVLAACGGEGSSDESGQSGELTSLTVGYPAQGAAYAELYLCDSEGIWEDYGLDVELELLNSSSQLLAALSSNSVQIVGGVGTASAAGALQDVPISFISVPLPYYYMELWGDSSIDSVEDLKGKKIGLSAVGSLGDIALDAWLEREGWSESDVEKTFLNSSGAAAAGLQQGAVEAVVTQPPNSARTGEHGAEKVFDFADIPAAANAYVTLDEYNEENSEAVSAFVAAQVECLALAKDDRDLAVEAIMEYTEDEDRELAEYSYDFFEPLWQEVPEVAPELIEESFAIAAAEAGEEPPEDVGEYIDNSHVEGAE